MHLADIQLDDFTSYHGRTRSLDLTHDTTMTLNNQETAHASAQNVAEISSGEFRYLCDRSREEEGWILDRWDQLSRPRHRARSQHYVEITEIDLEFLERKTGIQLRYLYPGQTLHCSEITARDLEHLLENTGTK